GIGSVDELLESIEEELIPKLENHLRALEYPSYSGCPCNFQLAVEREEIPICSSSSVWEQGFGRWSPGPEEYIFRDEGYSGAVLICPGLERIRDLSAEGPIQAVLALLFLL
ncbi:MAG: hypothetical protein WD555_05605, partial [Fulvivirga sp.]